MAKQTQPADSGLGVAALGRKGQILAAALEVFGECGYEGGSMRDIASRVGVSEAALYRHFSGKEAIFLALIGAVGTRVREDGIALLKAVRAETLTRDLATLVSDRRQTARLYAPTIVVILPVAVRNAAWLAEARVLIFDPIREALIEKVTQIDVELGVPDAEETRSSRVRALMSLFFGYIASTIVLADEQDQAIVETVLRVMRWDSGGTLKS
ncbi:MAG: hypothetical protein CVT67_05825 [Actinobacteria bacterium HGW-Actinobacteria-7]|nr:MAG: hypothetical protein CVT67_05825 [Actinobacteria bacterium HGW-Actinobacteria-7]